MQHPTTPCRIIINNLLLALTNVHPTAQRCLSQHQFQQPLRCGLPYIAVRSLMMVHLTVTSISSGSVIFLLWHISLRVILNPSLPSLRIWIGGSMVKVPTCPVIVKLSGQSISPSCLTAEILFASAILSSKSQANGWQVEALHVQVTPSTTVEAGFCFLLLTLSVIQSPSSMMAFTVSTISLDLQRSCQQAAELLCHSMRLKFRFLPLQDLGPKLVVSFTRFIVIPVVMPPLPTCAPFFSATMMGAMPHSSIFRMSYEAVNDVLHYQHHGRPIKSHWRPSTVRSTIWLWLTFSFLTMANCFMPWTGTRVFRLPPPCPMILLNLPPLSSKLCELTVLATRKCPRWPSLYCKTFQDYFLSHDIRFCPVLSGHHGNNTIKSKPWVVSSIFLRLQSAASSSPSVVHAVAAVHISNDLYGSDTLSVFETANGYTKPVADDAPARRYRTTPSSLATCSWSSISWTEFYGRMPWPTHKSISVTW